MQKKILLTLLVLAAACATYFLTKSDNSSKVEFLTTQPQKELFVQSVFASGELKAKKSLKIRAPQGMRAAGVFNTSISDLITEGTIVKKGDYVGSLDRTELSGKISEINTSIETEQTKLDQAKIDTAIALKAIRDQIADVIFNMSIEELEMEKNVYESDMVIEQSKINLKKSERNLVQLKSKQKLIEIQSIAQIKEVEGAIKQLMAKRGIMTKLSGEFSIKAPEAGMLIYARDWNGKKGVGSRISGWDPVVAELPDLSKMITIAYVNEVDISKIKKGQLVDIKVDAFPEKDFTGSIIQVANIGQELRNQDAKVFEITIEINEVDEVLKPAMTTSNHIKIYEYEEVLTVPLDAYYSDSIDYVFIKENNQVVKQEVVSGAFNEDHIVILSGITEADNLLLSKSKDQKFTTRYLEDGIKQEANTQLEKWRLEKEAYDKENLEKVKSKSEGISTESVASNMIIIG